MMDVLISFLYYIFVVFHITSLSAQQLFDICDEF